MKNTRLFLKPGEKGRLEASPKLPIDESTIRWDTTSNVVVMDGSRQKTPLDMAIVALGAEGMGYVEFSASLKDGSRRISHVFEIHVDAGDETADVVGSARPSRSNKKDANPAGVPKDARAYAEPPKLQTIGEKNAPKPDGTSDLGTATTQAIGADNPVQAAGLPAQAPDPDTQTIEELPVNDKTTQSIGGTITSPGIGSGEAAPHTVVGIDTVLPVENVPPAPPETQTEPTSDEDQKKIDEALKAAQENDRKVAEGADGKLPSEAETSGTPKDTVDKVPKESTVAPTDSRRQANRTKAAAKTAKTASKKAKNK